ncbi:hypothetical protein BaRGS_00005038 [Batillaria attramentaria]|uniref:Ribosomal RNA-processing protein 43 n=1 Tax=Batillaria attramentaria TaxID=370345 RepID=A0ABD0LWA3_9CAEN
MADEFRTAQPKEYYRKFLEKDVRPDNRELGEFRPTVLNIGSISTAEGSALIKLGNTTVICGVKGELAEPKTETPKEGYIVPNVELSALCSPQFRPGPPSEQAQVLSQFVADVIKNLGNWCGCSALKNTALPTVTVDEETKKVETDFKQQNMLHLSCCPISSTCAVFDDTVLLVDPTSEEQTLATGIVTVVTDGKNICCLDKPGGSPLTDSQMRTCIERAFQRHREACKLMEDTLCSIDR